MRNKKWFARADWILWTFISILPLLAYLLYLTNGDVSHSGSTFNSFMSGYGVYTGPTSFLYNTLMNIFGPSGAFPLFASGVSTQGIQYFITFFISIHILHIFVDFLLFIPRLAHKFMDGFLGGD